MAYNKDWFYGRGVDEAFIDRHERHELRKIIGILCIVGVLVGLFLGVGGCAAGAPAAAPAISQVEVPLHVYERGRTSIRLMRGPCVDPYSLAFITRRAPEYAERARAIASTWPMQDGTRRDYAGCWLEFTAEEAGGEASFALIFEDGQRFLLPKSEVVGGGV